jgi:hypothetical protein
MTAFICVPRHLTLGHEEMYRVGVSVDPEAFPLFVTSVITAGLRPLRSPWS